MVYDYLNNHLNYYLNNHLNYGLDQASHSFSDIPLGFAEIQTFLDSWGFLQNFQVAFPACLDWARPETRDKA